MLAIERKNEILNKLRTEQRVLVAELAAHYGVTEETIRRDLDKLEKEGHATKTYGGAIWGNSTKTDLSYTIRNKTNVDAKNAIAEIVRHMVMDGDHIMLDDSSTCLYIAKQLKEKKNLTVITNSVEIVMELADVEGWTILSTGGRLKPDSLAFVGHQVQTMLANYHVDKTFLSCKGLDMEKGITDAINAIRAINESQGKIVVALDIYGQIEPSYEEKLNALVAENSDFVTYGGIVDSQGSVEVLKNYYALLFPTYWVGEGLPGTVVDAFAASLPVIATDWNANSEIIEHNKQGIIYPNGNIKSLKDAIEWSINHTDIMAKMRIESRAAFNRYTPNEVLKVILEQMNKK
jgi:DeoR/GlpR family transcriptional regulator of sugar metabolism